MCEHIKFLYIIFLVSPFDNEGVYYFTKDLPRSVFRGVAVIPYHSKLKENN